MTHAHIGSAVDELAALVVRMRGWDEEQVRRAITICHGQGWPFSNIALELVRLAVLEGTEPADLVHARTRKRKKTVYAAVEPSAVQLTALAAKMRDDWDEGQIRHALAVCHGSGWPFTQACLDLIRLATIPESEPRDMAAAGASQWSRRTLADRRARRG